MTRLTAGHRATATSGVLLAAALVLTGCSGSGHQAGPGSAGAPSGAVAPISGATSGGAAAPSPAGSSPAGPTRAASSGVISPSGTGTSGSRPSGAPGSGSIFQTVPSRTVHTNAPVAPRRTASFGTQVSVRATAITPITTVARGPGEIGGPGLEITLVFDNGSAHAISLGNVVVNLYDDTKSPAVAIDGAPADPVSGTLSPHRSATGRYVFTIAASRRTPITISVSYTPAAPIVQIVGNAD